MTTLLTVDMPLVLQTRPAFEMTEDEFYQFCRLNKELRIERNAEGELLIMAPAGGESGNRNFNLSIQLGIWVDTDGTGVGFDSSTGFILPNNATRSPDAAWVPLSRLVALTPEQKRRFLPLCPDFVAELLSPTDRIVTIQAKMAEYIANGARLGWLIDPDARRVYIYRPGAEVVELENPTTLSANPELPGFVLDLTRIWNPPF